METSIETLRCVAKVNRIVQIVDVFEDEERFVTVTCKLGTQTLRDVIRSFHKVCPKGFA